MKHCGRSGRHPAPAWAAVAGWLGGLALATFVLVRVGGVLPPASAGPVPGGFAALRWVAMVLCVYLSATTVAELAARATRVPGLVRTTDLVTLPVVRRLVSRAVATGLTLSLAAPGATHVLAATTAAAETTTPPTLRADGPPAAEPPPTLRAAPLPPDPPPAPTTGPAPAPDTGGDRWVIAGGDHLWRVSEATLRARWGRAPTDAETADYLQVLIGANRQRLVVPDDPDLVFPGQAFDLPPA